MTEQKKLQRSEEIREKYNNWDKEVVAEITREFLFNHRAIYLSYMGEMPSYFETGQNRIEQHNETPARQDAGPSHR